MAAALSLASAHIARADENVYACGDYPNYIFEASSQYSIEAIAQCPAGDGLELWADTESMTQGQNAIWQTVAPGGLTIAGATIPAGELSSAYVNDGNAGDYGGDFYWNGGSSAIEPGETSASFGLVSQYFGFQLVCGKPRCNSSNFSAINLSQIIFDVYENIGPTLTSPSGIWQAPGWIRGNWTLSFSGDSPSGMCSLTASLAGQSLTGTSAIPNVATWHQCTAPAVDDTVYTTAYPQGADTLQIGGVDAAGVPVQETKTIDIDNQQPTVSLTGPSQAPSTAGTQYVTATATAGPSGIAGIGCWIDGRPVWYPSASAQVPVDGIGSHQVRCYAENNAENVNGARAVSTTQTFNMKIGTPTVAEVGFTKLVDQLICRRTIERVRIPAGWVTVKVHGKAVRVREPAHTARVKVTRCRPRIVRRRVAKWVTVKRRGKKVRVLRHKTIRIRLAPHVVDKTKLVVGYGHGATVDGWLGENDGTALGDQPVDVLTAPDDGSQDFQPATATTTAADGTWSVNLPPGPSRLIEASYGGAATTESVVSAPATLIVPAKVELLRITPRRVAWGGTIKLVGALLGGYLPPGGALVRLRIGEGSAVTTYGVHEHVGGDGQFSTTYTFGAGDPSVHRSYWFQIASLPMGDYPYAPANSRRISVLVGGHPRSRRHRHHHHRR